MGTSATAWSVLPHQRLRHSSIAHFKRSCSPVQAGPAASALQGIEEGHELSAWHQPAAQNAQDAVRLWLGTQR